jgi:hypothetical protein
LWKRARTRPQRAVCKRRPADVRTFACRLTIRFVCGQKFDRSATAHWRGQVAISTAVRRGAARDECSICEESGDCVRASEIVMRACAVFIAMRPLHVIASEAKQSILSLRRRLYCFATLAMTVDTVSPSRGADRPRFAISFVPLEIQRAQGRPGARCTRGLACNCAQRTRTRAYRFSGNTPAFPAQWLYGLLRALPGERLFCHRRRAGTEPCAT